MTSSWLLSFPSMAAMEVGGASMSSIKYLHTHTGRGEGRGYNLRVKDNELTNTSQ